MSVFASTNILLPQIESLQAWSVVACDQFTSQPEYWERVRNSVGDKQSTIHIIFPEAELECDKEKRIASINKTMQNYVEQGLFQEYPNSYIYLERTMRNGTIRKGLVGAVDLEAYDYGPIEEVLQKNTLENCRNGQKQEIGDVILTGATGFLGIHILCELLKNYLQRTLLFKRQLTLLKKMQLSPK